MAQDFLLDDENEMIIRNGDFALGVSDEQHVEDILFSEKGHWKQYPLVGVGIIGFINAPENLNTEEKLKKEISTQLEYDDVVVNNIDATDFNNIQIDCDRF